MFVLPIGTSVKDTLPGAIDVCAYRGWDIRLVVMGVPRNHLFMTLTL